MKYLPFAPMILAAFAPGGTAAEPPAWAEIRVVDSATGRGVPLVELETVHGLRFVTDNAGRVAFCEPGLMGREIFFTVRSHGHSVPKDGFGIAGARVTPNAGKPAEIRIARNIVAERLCRLTGEGLYRDSLLLGHKSPLAESAHPGKVAGQDSIQAAVYRGKVHYFWGDTLRMDYPLGLFRMAGATTDVPDPKDRQSDPAAGIAYDYFTDAKTGFARALMPLPERPEGVIWISGVFVVPDAKGADKLVGHYSRRKGLEKEYEQGLAVFDDAKGIFESAKTLPATEAWRKPNGHPIPFEEDGGRWLLFGSPNPNVRVPATLKDVLDPDKYEAYACEVDKSGTPTWSWQKARPPTDSKTERRWIAEKKLKPESARFCPADAANPAEGRYHDFTPVLAALRPGVTVAVAPPVVTPAPPPSTPPVVVPVLPEAKLNVVVLKPKPPSLPGRRKAGDKLELTLPGNIKLPLAWCPPGQFRMGSDEHHADENPAHIVTLTRGFWMAVTPVT